MSIIREALPTVFHMNNKCKYICYGCCKLLLDSNCSIRIKFDHITGIYTIEQFFLYRKNGNINKKNLNIAKEDLYETNCPNFERLMYEPLWYNVHVSNYIFCYTLIIIILLLCLSCYIINYNNCYKYEKILVSSDSV